MEAPVVSSRPLRKKFRKRFHLYSDGFVGRVPLRPFNRALLVGLLVHIESISVGAGREWPPIAIAKRRGSRLRM
jgi:hypothetical protein